MKECSSADVPDTLIGALKECSVLAYPNLNVLLILALTLPITSCEREEFQSTEVNQDYLTCHHVRVSTEFTCIDEDQP